MTQGSESRVVMGLMFFPRGGSAQVVRALATQLPAQGWAVTLVASSLRGGDGPADARRFFATTGADLHALDATAALAAPDPLRADPPLHPSYEDRPRAQDRVFARVDDATYEHQVAAWARMLAAAGAARADVLHLHHLTPLNEAAARVAPDIARVGHLHGTELLMLEQIAAAAPSGVGERRPAGAGERSPAPEPGAEPPDWPFAAAWAARMRRWAAGCDRLIVLSPSQRERVERLLGVPHERCVEIPNGFDPRRFVRRRPVDRGTQWRTTLVRAPRGWRPGAERPGAVAYAEADIAPLLDPDACVLLYVGRFTAVKRLGLLIRAHARARERVRWPAPLVIVGGFPGEWEDEHPWDVVREVGARDVYLAGWHDQSELPSLLNAADALVLPSVREQFGQVLVEAMACGLPAIAVDAHGPAEIVEDGRSGWLVPPDDETALADALVAAVDDPAERRRRGAVARAAVGTRYAWPAIAARVARCYDEARRAARERARRPASGS